jgi:hypothetical protein
MTAVRPPQAAALGMRPHRFKPGDPGGTNARGR